MALKPKGGNIPNDHHIIRHCKKRQLIIEDDKIVGLFPEVFNLRPPTGDRPQEKYLSAIYYEYFSDFPANQMKSCCQSLPLKSKPKDALARVNVGKLKAQGEKRKRKLRVVHEPKTHNHAYAAVRGVPEEADDELSSLIAEITVMEIIEVVTL